MEKEKKKEKIEPNLEDFFFLNIKDPERWRLFYFIKKLQALDFPPPLR